MLSTGGISAFADENPTANTSTQKTVSAAEATTELTTQSPEEALNQQKTDLEAKLKESEEKLAKYKEMKEKVETQLEQLKR